MLRLLRASRPEASVCTSVCTCTGYTRPRPPPVFYGISAEISDATHRHHRTYALKKRKTTNGE